MVAVDGVADAAVIGVAAFTVENVVDAIFQAPKAKRRAAFASFGRVVEDHIQDHFDPGQVEGFYHVAKFIEGPQGAGSRAVTLMGSEKGNRRIAPIVLERRVIGFLVELLNRQKLDGRDA